MKNPAVSLALATILLSSAVGGAVLLERRDRVRRADHQDIVYLPPAWLVRTASVGYRTLVADYYWLQALQYTGNTNHRQVYFRDLHRYVGMVVDLDPDFEFAYEFGGTIVPYNAGSWRWHNVDEAIALLERGVERFPESTRLWLQLGYTHAVLREDYAAAAEAFRQASRTASRIQGWVPTLVTRLEATTGRLDRARAYAEEVIAHSDDPHLVEAMTRRLAELDVEAVLQDLEAALSAYAERHGRPAERLDALVDAGLLDAIPPCPLDGAFALGPDGAPYSTALEGGRLRAHALPGRLQGEEQRRADDLIDDDPN